MRAQNESLSIPSKDSLRFKYMNSDQASNVTSHAIDSESGYSVVGQMTLDQATVR